MWQKFRKHSLIFILGLYWLVPVACAGAMLLDKMRNQGMVWPKHVKNRAKSGLAES